MAEACSALQKGFKLTGAKCNSGFNFEYEQQEDARNFYLIHESTLVFLQVP